MESTEGRNRDPCEALLTDRVGFVRDRVVPPPVPTDGCGPTPSPRSRCSPSGSTSATRRGEGEVVFAGYIFAAMTARGAEMRRKSLASRIRKRGGALSTSKAQPPNRRGTQKKIRVRPMVCHHPPPPPPPPPAPARRRTRRAFFFIMLSLHRIGYLFCATASMRGRNRSEILARFRFSLRGCA
jgi:hypothetical protein